MKGLRNMQRTLFDMMKNKPKTESKTVEQKPVETQPVKRSLVSYIPKEGDRVRILNLNDGIEATIEYVDTANLFTDYMYPIQCNVEKLNNLMFRTDLKNVKPA